ncbi:tRNA (adenosine(37)-N6)-threonylcarbamoyltransferase complex dimerization subunit type 1 TsaB [Marinobacterium sediminicola]|uniref:tRNA threonylcarbamoyladenosine biosynthesis protein TsaB n=1 Tax=Marinobacterium sediminicola TaxID=518898 RepID=A0ABY1RZQ5_9GAMM|nr:tRNA (adenosine(37)-N6)-threonylcarbamoyltransferase complex dimerization subunit type 1 TsaB [Marinobacterium sediminicola]ULG69976.1 tRNA (adenosine(37)-N6)-threonylcarbamoyltransferase complex dimerization subunit type 1 TsaB [Marinobacterium sediminicola]SMR74427.1 tRNA threonylcarbamoyladenosine biosynthesis protein TsaB [Marinobacterium sediminicola]
MSNILALDTSTDACSAALLLNGEMLQRFKIEPRRHTHLLLPMVEELLAEAGVTLAALDAIAFGRGPGSFAGIRIATGAAQGLALAADLPVVPVSTLEAMAFAADANTGEYLLTALDARMDEVYWCAWQRGSDGLRALVDEQVCAPSGVLLPDAYAGISFAALGSGWVYREQMSEGLTEHIAQYMTDVYPQAEAMARLADMAVERGEVVSPDEAQPVYLRDQVAWKKKDQQ